MFDRLDAIERTYNDLTAELGSPELMADQKAYQKIAKQQRDLEKIVVKYREFKSVRDAITETRE